MALHELATNAGKYGALSTPAGRIHIGWEIRNPPSGNGEQFEISWQEAGGPTVQPPERGGFGSNIIQAAPRTNLGAEVELDFAPGGIRWSVNCPLIRVAEAKPARSVVKPSASAAKPIKPDDGHRILLVEDDWLVASEVADALKQVGYQVMGPVATIADAMALLDQLTCHAAILDINLDRETSEPIADRLLARGTPFVTLTGYDTHQIPERMRAAPRISKPVRLKTIVAEVDRLLNRTRQ